MRKELHLYGLRFLSHKKGFVIAAFLFGISKATYAKRNNSPNSAVGL
jgi:hypothetical protein